MNHRFIIGEEVVILRGERRGWIGKIRDMRKIAGGLIDLNIEFPDDTSILHTIPSEDCKPVDESTDIKNYLTDEEMHTVLLRIFTDKATNLVDEAIKNRTMGMGSITDQVLAAIAQKYIDKYFENMTPYVLTRFENVIKSDEPIVKDGDSKPFAASIQWNLERAAADYIEKNKEVVWSLMSDTIHELAKEMCRDQFIKIISDKIGRDFKKELEATINKDSEE